LLFSIVLLGNKFIIQAKSPDTPKEFSNAYDSWYATSELGKYSLEGNYDDLPPQLWSKLKQDHPYLNELSGKEAAKQKKSILYDSLLANPENFIVGSMIQMIKFYEVSSTFKERYHNTAGFLHIEFFSYRIFILFLFTLGGILSIYQFIRYKNYELLLFGLLFISVILSQPFLYGGEARTAATVLFFLSYIVIFGLFNLIEYIKSKSDSQYIFKKFQLEYNNNKTNIFVYCIPFLALSFFLYKGLNNNFNYLTDVKVEETLSCPEGYTLKNIVFNDKSGFYINGSKDVIKKHQKDFNDILDSYIDFAFLSAEAGIPAKINVSSLSMQDINSRDSFKFLNYFVRSSILKADGRLYSRPEREQKLLSLIGNVHISGGGFFIYPINKQSQSRESLIILREDMIGKGFNNISTCL